MFFSIIMPVYNAADYLKSSIESIISQGFEDYELILVNDGSQDESWSIINEYSSLYPQIKAYSHTNHGPAYTRNVGISKAIGDYILFIDSDDCYVANALQYLYKYLSENLVDVLCFGYEEIDKNKVNRIFLSEILVYNTKEEIEKNMDEILGKRVHISSTCNKAYSREFLINNRLKLPEEIYLAEDLLFNILVLDCASSYCFIPDCFYQYIHRNKSSIIKRYKQDKYAQLMICHKKRNEVLRKYCGNTDKTRSVISEDYVRICFSCFMDLFLEDCKMNFRDKLKFINDILQSHQEEGNINTIKFLRWKEKVVFLIYKTKNKYIIYYVARICHWLKFVVGIGF